MQKQNINEGLQRQKIEQYKAKGKDPQSRLKQIHDIVARHINSVINEINSEELTFRAVLYLGKETYDGQEYQFISFIQQIGSIIENGTEITQSDLDFIKRSLTTNKLTPP